MVHPLLQLARAAIRAHLCGLDWRGEAAAKPPQPSRGCFVSLKIGAKLRGCIGSVEPHRPSLQEEVAELAVAAANRDPRFAPVREDELARIRLSIDLLSPPEPIFSAAELHPAQYGLWLSAGGKTSVLLPDIPGVETAAQQLAICRRKAGIAEHETVHMQRFSVERISE